MSGCLANSTRWWRPAGAVGGPLALKRPRERGGRVGPGTPAVPVRHVDPRRGREASRRARTHAALRADVDPAARSRSDPWSVTSSAPLRARRGGAVVSKEFARFVPHTGTQCGPYTDRPPNSHPPGTAPSIHRRPCPVPLRQDARSRLWLRAVRRCAPTTTGYGVSHFWHFANR